MGSSISSSMVEQQRKNMEKQQKTMLAMSMAGTRDLCYWIGGVWGYNSIVSTLES
jgi:protein tyrosine phosphatase (PTP) superfamily phosphohydrolase (DUF442 family)